MSEGQPNGNGNRGLDAAPSFSEYVRAASEVWDVPADRIVSGDRDPVATRARMAVIFLMRQRGGKGPAWLAAELGVVVASITYAVKTVPRWGRGERESVNETRRRAERLRVERERRLDRLADLVARVVPR